MKKIDTLLLILIGTIFASLLFLSRQIFYFRYDPEYFENYYYNSQWNVPQSTRGISDGELYKFVGFQLANGENPFDLSYEVPPFGKYLYGLAEKSIGNPYWVTLGFFILTGFTIYYLSLELFAARTIALMGLLLFVTTPFLATQIRETMLDLPLTSLFLLNTLFFIKYLKKHRSFDLILAGGFLGLATGTKIGVYSPLLLLLGIIIAYLSSRKFSHTVLYLFSVAGGYVLSFFCYFIKHPNPIPWIRLHEKTINFYLQSLGGPVDYLNQWRGIFLNTYQGFWAGAANTGLGDWSLLLPVGVILSVIIFFKKLKKKDYSWIYLTVFTFIILSINTFLPFWARYLMPAVPLFIIFVLFAFKKNWPVIVLLVVFNLSVLVPTFTTNKIQGHANAVTRFLDTRAYRELYRSIDEKTKSSYEEKQFQQILENFYVTLRVKNISVSITDIIDTKELHQGKINIKYQSDFGEITTTQDINFVLEHNQWKTIWRWDYLYPRFDPNGKIEIVSTSKNPLTRTQKAVYVIPRLMYDWGKHAHALAILTKTSDGEVDKIIRQVIPDDFPRFVGYLDITLDQDTIKNNSLTGIYIKDESAVYPGSILMINSNGDKMAISINQD